MWIDRTEGTLQLCRSLRLVCTQLLALASLHDIAPTADETASRTARQCRPRRQTPGSGSLRAGTRPTPGRSGARPRAGGRRCAPRPRSGRRSSRVIARSRRTRAACGSSVCAAVSAGWGPRRRGEADLAQPTLRLPARARHRVAVGAATVGGEGAVGVLPDRLCASRECTTRAWTAARVRAHRTCGQWMSLPVACLSRQCDSAR
jgi:hypothetical protein